MGLDFLSLAEQVSILLDIQREREREREMALGAEGLFTPMMCTIRGFVSPLPPALNHY